MGFSIFLDDLRNFAENPEYNHFANDTGLVGDSLLCITYMNSLLPFKMALVEGFCLRKLVVLSKMHVFIKILHRFGDFYQELIGQLF